MVGRDFGRKCLLTRRLFHTPLDSVPCNDRNSSHRTAQIATPDTRRTGPTAFTRRDSRIDAHALISIRRQSVPPSRRRPHSNPRPCHSLDESASDAHVGCVSNGPIAIAECLTSAGWRTSERGPPAEERRRSPWLRKHLVKSAPAGPLVECQAVNFGWPGRSLRRPGPEKPGRRKASAPATQPEILRLTDH